MSQADTLDPRCRARVLELPLYVLEQSPILHGEIGDKYIGPAVVIVIPEIDAHAGKRLSVVPPGQTAAGPDFLELAVSQVPKQLLRPRIICDGNIQPAVAVAVVDRHPQTVSRMRSQARLHRYICKSSVVVVPVQDRSGRLKHIGMAEGARLCVAISAPNIR